MLTPATRCNLLLLQRQAFLALDSALVRAHPHPAADECVLTGGATK